MEKNLLHPDHFILASQESIMFACQKHFIFNIVSLCRGDLFPEVCCCHALTSFPLVFLYPHTYTSVFQGERLLSLNERGWYPILSFSFSPSKGLNAILTRFNILGMIDCFAKSFTFILGSKDLLREETTCHTQLTISIFNRG